MNKRILIIGANGQLGSSLVQRLRQQEGDDNVIASDKVFYDINQHDPLFETLDVLNRIQLRDVIKRHQVKTIYHLAAILSAMGEENPLLAWDLNMNGLINVLEAARSEHVERIFWPSSIAVFGSGSPRHQTPQNCYTDPMTIYGISKLAGERLCEYYHSKYHVDVRSLRYPGLISAEDLRVGGGTTDYAVKMYRAAVEGTSYTCYLKKETRLPMMAMEDAVRASVELMEADAAAITVRTSYNLGGMDFTPKELHASIQAHYPNFTVNYAPDSRQAIADRWPCTIDDTTAQKDWKWQLKIPLDRMTQDMLRLIEAEHSSKKQPSMMS